MIQTEKIKIYDAIKNRIEQREIPANLKAKKYREATIVLEEAVTKINEIIRKWQKNTMKQ